ncbi:MAG: hypothetical protein A2Y91_02160 [Chloroflexi bacterium RBG_13_54_8]|nr:MAG: hypothetical protein A2Y91_02160 [Chloroflexi bacterium RBG_13_54_8]
MTIDDAIQQFTEYLEIEKGFSPLTIRSYERYLRRFSSWAMEQLGAAATPESIDRELVRKYRLHLARLTDQNGQRLKKVTQSYHLIVLRAFLRYLSVQRNITTLSPDEVELPKASGSTIKFLASKDLDKLLTSPDTSNTIGLRDRAILETLFSTGLRVSELARLNRSQMDLDAKELGVVGKGGKPRVVFFSDSAAQWIRRYIESRQDSYEPLFIRYSGHQDTARSGEKMRLTPRSVQRILAKYSRRSFLPVKASPHTLRHSFATDLLIGGADIRSVQEMLGHKNIATTQVYTHVTDRHLKEVHKTFHGRSRKLKDDE